MRYVNFWLRLMLRLSYGVRLGIIVVVTLLCLALYLLTFKGFYAGGGSLYLSLPITLAAWLFKRLGMTVCLIGMFLTILSFHFIYHAGLLLSQQVYVFFVVGGLVLLLEGFLIASFRELFDVSDAMQQQAVAVSKQQQQLNQSREQFIMNMNHELRTPLTSVYGYLDLLLEHNEQLDPAARMTFLKNATDSCEELQLLVNNILYTLQVDHEQEALYLEELPVIDVVREVIEHFDPRCQQEYTLQMQVPKHLVVRANAQYLRQLLRNLLSNATKYSPKETPIIVSAALYGPTMLQQQRHVPQEVCIRVKDTGSGIPPEDIPCLFGQFVRLKRDTFGKVRGTGLGLYISKQLVEAMGGRIWVESAGIPGQGSTFCFTLPCVPRV